MKLFLPALGLLVLSASPVLAQSTAETFVATADTLPDSPGAVRVAAPSLLVVPVDASSSSTPSYAAWDLEQQQATGSPQIAKKYARTIPAGATAERWGAKEKFVAAFRKQVSLGGFFSPVFVAGVQQVRDSRPHYGTDSGAYGARIGAAYARQSTQQLLNLGVMSSLLHDDPRYYVLGPTHSFKSRVIYAATRVLITRKDDGGNTVNIPLFVGVYASQAMTNGFYPDQDRHWGRTLTGSLGSIGSKMATQQFKEFSVEIRQHIPFLKKKQ